MKTKNTSIEYMYRDADNYKKWTQVIVEGTLTEEQIDDIMGILDEGLYFIPCQVDLPEDRFDEITEADHCWFELRRDGFTTTDRPATELLSADTLYQNFLEIKEKGWDDSTDFA